jgi:hypothetical protein
VRRITAPMSLITVAVGLTKTMRPALLSCQSYFVRTENAKGVERHFNFVFHLFILI